MASAAVDVPNSSTETKASKLPQFRMTFFRGSLLESRVAVWVVEAAYVALLGFLFGKLIYALIEPVNVPTIVNSPSAEREVADVSIFTRHNPFSATGVVAPVVDSGYDDVEETRLALQLVGTFVDSSTPSATIQTEGGSQQLFFVGDEVVPGTSIRDVLPDRVILSRSGVTETLSLEGRDQAYAAAPTSAVPQRRPGTQSRQGNRAGDMLSAFVAMAPSPTGTGIILRAGSNQAMFQAAGLQDGDIVVASNGRVMPANLDQARTVMLRSLARGPVTLTIDRGGVTRDVTLDPTGLVP